MLIGVPKEIKDHEYRVGLIPATIRELTERGHSVIVEIGAGAGAGIDDGEYVAAGAEIVGSADDVFDRAEMIIKVKEPLAAERNKLKRTTRSCSPISTSPPILARPRSSSPQASPPSPMKR